jgi:hypothetical protein
MGDPKRIESLIDQAVSNLLNEALPGLREQLVQRVTEEVSREVALTSGGGNSALLNDALAHVQSGTTQVQILDAMVEGASMFAARTALYVVRGANAVGWRAKGFGDDDAVRSNPLELSVGLPAEALSSRTIIAGKADDFMNGFGEKFGAPGQECLVCPLAVRDKVVALVYADGGTDEHRMDRPAIEALVRSTGLWLEVFATRKITGTPQAHPGTLAAAAAATASPAQVVETAPELVATPAAATPEPSSASKAPLPAPTQEDEVQRKARRFAKLLVDEIKLYNQAKVSEGRQHRDLYDRLREDIEKSRATYDKRYGGTSANEGDYFNQELVRILADNDPALFGDNFPR